MNIVWKKIGDDKILESNEVKLLGVTIGNKLKFGSHNANMWQTVITDSLCEVFFILCFVKIKLQF